MNHFVFSYPTKVYFGKNSTPKRITRRAGACRKNGDAGLWRRFGEKERHL